MNVHTQCITLSCAYIHITHAHTCTCMYVHRTCAHTVTHIPKHIHTTTHTGIDYHFYREEIYTTTQSGLINQHTLDVTSDDAGVTGLTVVNSTLLVNRSGNDLGSIAVDWVQDDLYWIENQNTVSESTVA